ncbi:hypothetical protein [Nocardia crassostreae]|uniref:hypothetical protein n=1 Tax=Nocardia crassostreae TaxID=53428 RepID=UPI0012F7A4B5|nr:hypothetical protein [Nocardia crassostreae]
MMPPIWLQHRRTDLPRSHIGILPNDDVRRARCATVAVVRGDRDIPCPYTIAEDPADGPSDALLDWLGRT